MFLSPNYFGDLIKKETGKGLPPSSGGDQTIIANNSINQFTNFEKKRNCTISQVREIKANRKDDEINGFIYDFGVCECSARSVAQNQRVSLNLRNCTVMQLFEEIQQQTRLFFFYDQNIFRDKMF